MYKQTSLFTALLSLFPFFSWMPRRVLWLCWPRPALKLANQIPPPLPSWPPFPQAVWVTRNHQAVPPSPESSTSPMKTSPASSLTPSHRATAARTLSCQRGIQIKQPSGCRTEAPAVTRLHPFLPIPSRPAPALLPCTRRARPTDKAIPPPRSPRHTPRPRTWTAKVGARSSPARTVITTALAKRTPISLAWTGLS